MKQSYSTSEVAQMCHVTSDTIRKWAEKGHIAVFKTAGGHRRIRHDDLIQFLQAHQIPLPVTLRTQPPRLLIIDKDISDTSTILRVLKRTVDTLEIQWTSSIFEAGYYLVVSKPNVVFVDLEFENDIGYDMCSRIRSLTIDQPVCIVGLCSHENLDQLTQARKAGAEICMSKSPGPDEIRRVFAQLHFEIQ